MNDATAMLDTDEEEPTELTDEQRDRAEGVYNQALIENPDPHADGPLSALSHEQRVRVAALNMAKPLLSDKGLLGAGKAPDLSDLIRLSTWILDGNEEPLYPYTTADMVVLGPDLNMNLEGHRIYWHGIRFNREDDDAN